MGATLAEGAAKAAASDSSDNGSSTQKPSVSQPGDYRVRRALHNAEVDFTVDNDEDFRVVWKIDNERTHLTIINSNTETFTTSDSVRAVWAVAYRGAPLPQATLLDLLKYNGTRKMGSWCISDNSGTHTLYFQIVLPDNANGKMLAKASKWVAETADEMEKKLTGKDEF